MGGRKERYLYIERETRGPEHGQPVWVVSRITQLPVTKRRPHPHPPLTRTEGWGRGRIIWVVCVLVWGIGLRRLGSGCGRRLVTGSCVIRETTQTGCPRSRPRVSLSIYLSIYRGTDTASNNLNSPFFAALSLGLRAEVC